MAIQGTIFNWDDIVANNLSSCIVVALGGLLQRKSNFYMGSYLIDCILCLYPFSKLNCTQSEAKKPIYTAYQILWAHKYHIFYKLICEDFLMPLHQLIFLEECKCMSEGALEVICEYGEYCFYEEVTFLMMYGGIKAPSLLPRYATDYIVHKEAVR